MLRFFLFRLIAIVFGFYVLASAWLYLNQDNMIFLPDIPSREVTRTPDQALNLAYEEHFVATSDGERLHAWFVPRVNSDSVILVCHGNAGNISHRMETIRNFHQLGFNVLVFDYRGFGKSSGTPTEQGTYLDAEAIWDWLLARGYRVGHIAIFGRSLGGGVAIELAVRKHAAALILESTFTSVADMGNIHYPWFPVRLLTRTHYDNLAKVERLQSPLLILHSPDDEMIPFSQGLALFERAGPPKRFVRLTGGHNYGFRQTSEYLAEMSLFLNEFLPRRPQ